MQIAPTALISFSISTNVTALQACYGFTMGWVINFCEPRRRHLVMPFINKCHPRYRFVRRGNKWNAQLSALCKSIFTPRCIFSLVCLLTRVTTEITMASKGKPTPTVAQRGTPFPSPSGWVRPVSGVVTHEFLMLPKASPVAPHKSQKGGPSGAPPPSDHGHTSGHASPV